MREFANYFDAVFCLSMPASADRRRHIQKHLPAVGIERFEFFDAVGPDDPEVQRLYAEDKVARYPPCFRCGELTCGRDDCNNVLIPEQVATCVSFLRLWRHVLETGVNTVLVMEDDVVFADYAAKVSEAVLREGFMERIGLEEDVPTLLRLGWMLGEDHKLAGRVTLVQNGIKMSDPCFALNRAMCRKLLEAFDRVETTADEFIHRIVGSTVRNFTLQPPLASELSWSFGAVASLIHPKEKRIAYLQKFHPERRDEIEATIESVRSHVKHILYRPILAVGHPRCGSGYMSELFKACGLDVGHEKMGKHGISSWMFAVEDDEYPWALNPLARTRKNKHFGHVVQFVRDPRQAIPSIIRENRHAEKSYAFRRKHILSAFGVDLDAAGCEVERAMMSYLYWNKLVEAQAIDLTVRVEDAEECVLRSLKDWRLVATERSLPAPPPKNLNADKLYRGILPERPDLSDDDWGQVADDLKRQINEACVRYGYDLLYRYR
jgi:GR25 family glycosyltransferase involved in LPS biosynthesis